MTQINSNSPSLSPGIGLRGNEQLLDPTRSRVAILGSRACTAYGAATAAGLAAVLADDGKVVVAGLSYGIEASAHRGALAVDGYTIAVTASGLDRPYPLSHAALHNIIGDRGLLVSPCAPEDHPTHATFLERTNTLLDVVDAVILVESAPRSGSAAVAQRTLERGLPLFAIPGPVTSTVSGVPNRLIREQSAIAIDVVADAAEQISSAIARL